MMRPCTRGYICQLIQQALYLIKLNTTLIPQHYTHYALLYSHSLYIAFSFPTYCILIPYHHIHYALGTTFFPCTTLKCSKQKTKTYIHKVYKHTTEPSRRGQAWLPMPRSCSPIVADALKTRCSGAVAPWSIKKKRKNQCPVCEKKNYMKTRCSGTVAP